MYISIYMYKNRLSLTACSLSLVGYLPDSVAQQHHFLPRHREALDYCDEAMAVLGGEAVAEAPAAAAASGGFG